MLPMIKVRGLGKRYRLGERAGRDSFRETINATIKAPLRLLNSDRFVADDDHDAHIWALRNVSFDVMPGDVLGVIGRNGGGKSTLLKIISRITHPTGGQVALYGRVGSLLEVGTGFHPELTGRENIFLNGAILGMKRAEIANKFDEIVEFSGVEKFLDTPVKRYSSGMYVRLAFAVAAHLEPEILLVDEVLAVGDSEFQAKCLGKMNEVARGGRTVFFVSHNITAVEALCNGAIFPEAGHLRMIGNATDVISAYAKSITDASSMSADLRHHSGRSRDAKPMITEIAVVSNGADPSVVRTGDSIAILVSFQSPVPMRPCCSLTIKTDRGMRIFHVSDYFTNQLSTVDKTNSGTITCFMDDLPLLAGRYFVDLWLSDFVVSPPFDMVADACSFQVAPTNLFGSGKLLPASHEGPIFMRGQWSLGPLSRMDSSDCQKAIGLTNSRDGLVKKSPAN